MSLADPTSKMSKSDENENAYIAMLDDRDTIIRKFKRAVTDSDSEVVYREGKEGVNNLLTIYSAVTGRSISDVEKEFADKGYGDFKTAVGEAVADCLSPVQNEYNRLTTDKEYVESIYKKGAEHASLVANKTLRKVQKKIGFVAL